jgi:hypothetical protein
MPGYALNGLKREELIATNSKLLHELYFDSLGGAGQAMVPAMELALMASFGSVAVIALPNGETRLASVDPWCRYLEALVTLYLFVQDPDYGKRMKALLLRWTVRP